MTDARAEIGRTAVEIHVADRLPEDGEPTDFYKSMLDDVNDQARFYGWAGVTFKRVRFIKETRVFSIGVTRGAAPATLHLMRKHIAETSEGKAA